MNFSGEQHPGVQAPAGEHYGFRLNHTMVRVRDPEAALAFYTRIFGMRVLRRLDFPEMQFSLYFLAILAPDDQPPQDPGERTVYTFSQRGLLELTHNWGSERQADFHYHSGNVEPQGFGHLCFAVPDLGAAEAWLDANDVEFIKRADQGKMKDVIFVRDPDGYWLEVVQPSLTAALGQ